MDEIDLKLGDGRILHVYDTGADKGGGGLPVFWDHGTPNIGSRPAPLFPAAERLGLRWVSYDRPGYGGSTPDPGRDLGSAADLVSSVADALGIAEKQRYEASGAEYDPEFTAADEAALAGGWSWLLDVVRPALAQGPGGLIDDDLAYVAPWGAEVEQITAPTLILHGGRDRVVPSAHAEWLADRCPAAELRLSPDEGHISILGSASLLSSGFDRALLVSSSQRFGGWGSTRRRGHPRARRELGHLPVTG